MHDRVGAGEEGHEQDVRAVRGVERSHSDRHAVLCKVRLVGGWIKSREVVGYARSLERKRVELDGEKYVAQMWEQVERKMAESAREVCGSVRARGKNPKSAWW